MTDREKVDFYERWIKALDNIAPDIKAKMNRQSIAFTGKYVCVDARGIVTISQTESRWAPDYFRDDSQTNEES